MDKFVWTDDYSVGIALIDEQHKRFFEIANEVLDLSSKKDVKREALLIYLEELGNYAFYHLGTEEKFFDEFKYEGALRHKAAHDAFRKIVKENLDSVRSAVIDADIVRLSEDIASFTSDWLKNHIIIMDKQYAVFFQEHGLK